ncbi:MAG: universal stress protein [Tepidisphaeraceae bacterium]|jgi:nucleotide-binding universal stress UspA family protein
MQKLLAFIDFSQTTPAVLKAANAIAGAFDMKLLLVHVSTPDAEYEGDKIRTNLSRHEVAAEMRRHHRALHILALECRKLGVDATALLVKSVSARGNPAPKIVREAARLRPSLIVMGTHGHGRLHDLLLGSASSSVVRKARCPVLLIPSPATEPPWPASSRR